MKRYRNALIFILLPLLCITAALLFGRYSISLRDVLRALFRPELTEAVNTRVVWYLRLPRAIAAAMCGAALATASAVCISGTIGWLPVIANLEYSAAVFRFRDQERKLKYAFILNMVMYVVFSFAIMNYVGAVANIVVAVTTAISLFRERRKAPGDVREDG